MYEGKEHHTQPRPDWVTWETKIEYLPEAVHREEGLVELHTWLSNMPYEGALRVVNPAQLRLACLGLGLALRDLFLALQTEDNDLPPETPEYIRNSACTMDDYAGLEKQCRVIVHGLSELTLPKYEYLLSVVAAPLLTNVKRSKQVGKKVAVKASAKPSQPIGRKKTTGSGEAEVTGTSDKGKKKAVDGDAPSQTLKKAEGSGGGRKRKETPSGDTEGSAGKRPRRGAVTATSPKKPTKTKRK